MVSFQETRLLTQLLTPSFCPAWNRVQRLEPASDRPLQPFISVRLSEHAQYLHWQHQRSNRVCGAMLEHTSSDLLPRGCGDNHQQLALLLNTQSPPLAARWAPISTSNHAHSPSLSVHGLLFQANQYSGSPEAPPMCHSSSRSVSAVCPVTQKARSRLFVLVRALTHLFLSDQ